LTEVFTGKRPRLLVHSQNGWANEPLPLGLIVEHASNGATVTIEGLPDGADLSLGSRANRFGWTVPATDLEQTFVGTGTDFVGVVSVRRRRPFPSSGRPFLPNALSLLSRTTSPGCSG
jgi:hypothetical protein